VASAAASLARRIRELRRRHFGPRGKGEFARRLGIPLEQYEAYERSRIPPGDVMVRMCEVTGEDLQWLLTGKPSRDTFMISGVRPRHRRLLTHLAETLNRRPELAAPVEAFLDLLTADERAGVASSRRLGAPPRGLIPILDPQDAPQDAPQPDAAPALPAPTTLAAREATRATAALVEPGSEAQQPGDRREVCAIEIAEPSGRRRRYLESAELLRCFPNAFAVVISDDSMWPMFEPGDAALVAPGCGPVVGRPALCRLREQADVRCRVWLGEHEGQVHLGRIGDGEHERVPRDRLRWSLEVLFRVVPRG